MSRIEAPTAQQTTEVVSQPSIKVHIEPTTPECQRYWDETVQNLGNQVSYQPEDDTYIVPAAFPIELLAAFNGQVVSPQRATNK